MGLENLKSVFNDLTKNVKEDFGGPSGQGVHGGLTSESPSTPPHSTSHTVLDKLSENIPITPKGSLDAWKGVHGGLTNESPSTPAHPTDHSVLDDLSRNIPITPNGSLYPWEGRHGGLSNEFPSTPAHSTGHSVLDKGVGSLGNPQIFTAGGYTLSGIIRGRHGGLTNERPSTPAHQTGHSTLDAIEQHKVLRQPISFKDPNSPQTKQPSISINDVGVRKREDELFQSIGQNNRLGVNDFVLESLYNKNHKAVSLGERTPINTGRLDKDGKPIIINTLRSGMGDLNNLDIMGYSSAKLDNFRGFNRGDEPYIVQPIGSDRYTTLTSRDGLPLRRALDDTSRLLKFYTSGAGLAFIAKENIINFLTSKIDPTNLLAPTMAPPFANPLQGNTGFLNITNDAIQDLGNRVGSLRRPLLLEYSGKSNLGLPFGNLGDNLLPIPVPKLPKGFLTDESPGFIKKKIISAAEGLLKKISEVSVPNVGRPTPFMDLSGGPKKTEYDDKINKSGGIGGFVVGTQEHKISPLGLLGDGNGDFYVRFKDLRHNLGENITDGVFLYFRGFVTGITENVSPTFTPTNYIGRSEPVYQYERAERDLSFNLRVYPNNKKEFDTMYKKINYLTGMTYPMYLEDDNNSSLTRMKAPFTELYMAQIGSRAKGQFGFIKSISYTVPGEGDWDSQTALPRLFDISISYQILNKKPPSFRTPFYRGQNSIGETV